MMWFLYQKKQQVMILGAVQRPGIYELRKEDTCLIDILAEAGGGVLTQGDAGAIAITRKVGDKQEVITADAAPGLTGRSGGGDNPRLMPDDLILCRKAIKTRWSWAKCAAPPALILSKSRPVFWICWPKRAVRRSGPVKNYF